MARRKLKALLSRRAERDINEIYSYLLEQSPEALRKVDQKLFKALRRLESFPLSGHLVKEFPRYREVLVYRYRVIYRVLQKSQRIHVLTVYHGRRLLPFLP